MGKQQRDKRKLAREKGHLQKTVPQDADRTNRGGHLNARDRELANSNVSAGCGLGSFAVAEPSLTGAPVETRLHTNGMPFVAPGVTRPMKATHKYSPEEMTLVVRQEVVCRPPILPSKVAHYSLLSALPSGLELDPVTGVIQGLPAAAFDRQSFFVEATSSQGGSTVVSVTLEVIDFTQGGYTVGHISEHVPGVYMVIVHVPEESESAGLDAGFDTDVSRNTVDMYNGTSMNWTMQTIPPSPPAWYDQSHHQGGANGAQHRPNGPGRYHQPWQPWM